MAPVLVQYPTSPNGLNQLLVNTSESTRISQYEMDEKYDQTWTKVIGLSE
jgi:hypothetical protein